MLIRAGLASIFVRAARKNSDSHHSRAWCTFRICELLELTRLDSVLDISRSEGVGGRGVAVAPPDYPFFPLLDGWSTRS
jgi:hypothetical protein